MLGTQDVKAKGIDWVRAEIAKWSEDINRDTRYMHVLDIALEELEKAEAPQPTQTLDLDVIGDIPIELLVPDEDARTMIKNKFVVVVNNLTKSQNVEISNLIQKHMNEVNGYQERELQLKRQNEELQGKANENNERIHTLEADAVIFETKISDLMNELHEANLRVTIVEQNRQNAANQLEEANETIQALRDELDRIKSGHKFTEDELKAQAEEARQAWMNKRIKVTNVRWEDEYNRKMYLAERADTGETIRYNQIEKGLYLEVSAEEAEQFRLEYELTHISPPDLPGYDENLIAEAPAGTQDHVEESNVVFGGSETPEYGNQDQGEPEALEDPAEALEETISEEVGETWEQSIERRVAELEAWKNSRYAIAS